MGYSAMYFMYYSVGLDIAIDGKIDIKIENFFEVPETEKLLTTVTEDEAKEIEELMRL